MGEEEEEEEGTEVPAVAEELEEAGADLLEVKCEVRGPEVLQTRGGLLITTGEMTGRPRLGTTEVAEEEGEEDGEVVVVEEVVVEEVEVEVGDLTTETETRREQKTLSEKCVKIATMRDRLLLEKKLNIL